MEPGRKLTVLTVTIVAAATAMTDAARASSRWLAPTTLSAPAASVSEGADIAGDPAGNAVAVWTRVAGNATCCTIVQAATRPVGGPWSAPRDLSAPGVNARAPRVEMDAAGNAVIVWAQDSAGGTVIRHRTRPAGGDFSASAPLSEAEVGHDASAPELAVNAHGAAVVVWTRKGVSAQVVQAATRASASGGFSLPVQLSDPAATTDASGPRVGIDPAGNAVAAWAQSATTPRVDSSSRPAGGTWSLSRTVAFGSRVELSVGADGRAIVLAVSDNWAGTYAWRTVTPSFATGLWSVPQVAAGESTVTPLVALDVDGTALILYQFLTGPRMGLFARVLPPIGSATAISDGRPYPDREPRAFVVGPRGGTMALWNDASATIASRTRPPGGAFGPTQLVPASSDGLVRGRMGAALDEEGNAIAVWQQQLPTGWVIRAAGYDAAPPAIAAISGPATVSAGGTADLSAVASDRWSGLRYVWRFSDGSSAEGVTVSRTFATPGAEEVTLTVTDDLGNTSTAARTIEVLAPPQPSPVPPPDTDRDGVPDEQDCRPQDAAISPIAREIPGNAVDENCDGVRDPFPSVLATVQLTSQKQPDRTTQLLRLTVRGAVAGDVVRMRCTGGGCRKAMNRTIKVRSARPTLVLTKYVAGVRLRPRARLEVRVAHEGRTARIYTFEMRASKTGAPQQVRLCEAPGAKEPKPC